MDESPQNQALARGRVHIRNARATDMEAVAAIDAVITDTPKSDYWARAYHRYATRQGRYFLVAESAGAVCGFILGEERAWEFGSPPCGWIFAIGVDPKCREGGVGTALFEAICAAMREAGMTTVRTMLARDDGLNMAFFRSQGMMGGSFIELEMPLDRGDTR